MADVMTQLSKDGTVLHPTEDKVDVRLLGVKYAIFRDMAETQTRYRQETEAALSQGMHATRSVVPNP
jgi:hypothetical protein